MDDFVLTIHILYLHMYSRIAAAITEAQSIGLVTSQVEQAMAKLRELEIIEEKRKAIEAVVAAAGTDDIAYVVHVSCD